MKKRVLSILLAVITVFAAMSVIAFAADGNVAAIGETQYATLAEAIAEVKNGETITLLDDCAENVTIKQKKNVRFTLDGANHTYTGTLTVEGTGYAGDQNQGLTIQNVNFVVDDYGIYMYKKNNYARNVTIDSCTFTGAEGARSGYGIGMRHVYNIVIRNTEGDNLYELVYAGGSLTGFTAENIKVTDSTYGITLSYVNSTANFKGLDMECEEAGLLIMNYTSGTVNIEDANFDAGVAGIVLHDKGSGRIEVNFEADDLSGSADPMVLNENKAEFTVPELGDDTNFFVDESGNVVAREARYKIQHLLLTSKGEVLKAYATYEKDNKGNYYKGKVGQLTAAAPISIAGYTAVEPIEQKTISGDEVVMVKIYYAPNTNTQYKVQHQLMTPDGEKVYKAYATYTYKGTTNTKTNAQAIEIPGYTVQTFEQVKIAGDGSTMVIIKYMPNTDTKYKVQHLLLDATGEKVYKAHATYTYTGTTDRMTKAEALTNIPGYTAKAFEQERIAGDGSTMVKIYYTRNDYTLTYDLAGGEFADDTEAVQTVQYMKKLNAPADPVREGYTFVGWDPAIPERMPAGDLTVTALWSINQYTITFANTGDTVIEPITQDYGTDVPEIADPEKTGYTFVGWDKEVPATIPAEDLTITAQWSVNQYTITFANTGDTVIEPITQGYGTDVPEIADPEKTGYTFAGWDVEIPATMPANDLTVTAQWVPNTTPAEPAAAAYYVRHYVETEPGVYTLVETEILTAELGKTVTADTAKHAADGYHVDESKSTLSGNVTIDLTTENPVDTLLALEVYYSLNEYTVQFDAKGGTEVAPQTVKHGCKVIEPAKPVRFGYTFVRWELNGAAYDFDSAVTGNMTLTAKWKHRTGTYSGPVYHKITVEVDGVVSSHKEACKGEIVTLKVEEGVVVVVVDEKGNKIDLSWDDGVCKFRMPDCAVVVKGYYFNPFIDVANKDYYADAVLWALRNGITNGITANTFCPDMICTRAQMVTFLWRAAGKPQAETAEMPFTDVSEGAYYYDAVLWAVENGITNGTSATTFSPNAEVTRAQTVTFLWRMQNQPEADGEMIFTDVKQDAYYAEAVLWAVEAGITNGTSATTFSPNAGCTRAQIVTFLWRCFK